MLPVNYGGHSAYQDTFVSEFLDLFPDPFAVPKQTWDIIVKFWYLDLSETDTIMQEFYSLLGKPATRFPSCLLRSYLLSIALKVDSITEWCRLLKITPLYAISESILLSHSSPSKDNDCYLLSLHKGLIYT